MGLPTHTVNQGKGSTGFTRVDEITIVSLLQVAYGAGGGAGAAVTVAVAGLSLPANYTVFIGDLGQDATAFISARTTAGFTVNIRPRLAANTLAAGAVDLKIMH